MAHRMLRIGMLSVIPAFALIVLIGCGSQNAGLPTSVTVELPDGTTAEAEQGAGIPSLADSVWQFYRTAGAAQSLAFLTITFGPDGSLEGFEDNTIAPEIFGSSIRFDGRRHETNQKGLQYAASTYGAETPDGTGFAFEGRLTAFAVSIPAGYATANATGTFNPDDPDTMTGTFSYSTRVTLVSIPEANTDDEFAFIAHRVVE